MTDQQRLELSERVRSGEISAFVEIPAGIFAMPAAGDQATTDGPNGNDTRQHGSLRPFAKPDNVQGDGEKARFYAQNVAFSEQRSSAGSSRRSATRSAATARKS